MSTREEQVTQFNSMLDAGIVQVDSITSINHRPHPYTIGPKHLSRNSSMYLGDSQIQEMERKHGPMCAAGNCRLRYEEHKFDMAAILVLKRDVSQEEIRAELLKINGEVAKAGIDGYVFLETGHRITP